MGHMTMVEELKIYVRVVIILWYSKWPSSFMGSAQLYKTCVDYTVLRPLYHLDKRFIVYNLCFVWV